MVDFSRLTKDELIEQLRRLQRELDDLRSAPEDQRLSHNLQVYQVELEVQNRELRETQATLELSRDRYADLYDFAPLGYVTLDAKGHIVEINLTGAELLDKERSYLINQPFSSFLHSEDIAQFFRYLHNVMVSDSKCETELRIKKGPKNYRYCHVDSIAIPDMQGKDKVCRSAIIDISERKHNEQLLSLAYDELEQRVEERTAELKRTNQLLQQEVAERERVAAQLRESEKRYRSVVESQTELICRWRPDGTLTFVNDAYCRSFGLSRKELIGHSFLTLIPQDERERVRQHIATLNGDNPVTTFENRVIARGGKTRWQRWANHVILDAKGRVNEIQSVGNDVTEQHHAEQELQKYRTHLEELVAERTTELRAVNKELEAFSYSIAHDLRAPIRAVTSFSQILLDDAKNRLNDEETDSLNRIVAAGRYMAQLVDDILGLAKVTRKEMKFETVDVSALCLEEANRLQQSDPERRVRWNIKDGVTAWGDRKALAIMINNLLANAWKFTRNSPEPHIEFGEVQKPGEQAYYIRDNGVGLDMRYASKLFRAFVRLHSDEEFEGTGIGLATVRHIISRHRGEIWVQSEVGIGTTIYFQLPKSAEEFKNSSRVHATTTLTNTKKNNNPSNLENN
jgi:PAS domain S-box-containing protein